MTAAILGGTMFECKFSWRHLASLGFLALVLGAPLGVRAELDEGLLAGMKARSIGPAGMSGRIAAVAGVPGDENLILVGTASGGLWKSVDGGVGFQPIFDDEAVASIGAVAIEPGNPDVIWVGTGEANPRNSASVGNGVYKSLDGGSHWAHAGLEKSEHIHRIVIDPRDPDIVYVAALGPAWSDGGQRGVYKTVDGGKSWKKILSGNERTGCAELVMDPVNPRKLFAALWEFRRWPWFFQSGGSGSGLFVSQDGGDSWTPLTAEDGLPKGELGRIGVAISRSDPRVVYALVEAKKNVLLRSEDGGASFHEASHDSKMGNRPFYFGDIHVDPEWPHRMYSLWSEVSVSNDGGKNFEILVGWNEAHPDHHSMWIDPENPRRILLGNDGGVYISLDRGESWRFASNLPVGQYYHIAVDMDQPYHVYGGMQDNGSWRGPSAVWENGGIRNYHWEEVGFGDGFDTRPDPRDSMRGISMSQEGYLMRWDLRTGERKSIRPAPPDSEKLRFNWNAGFAQDPFEDGTIYLGSQYLHKSEDRGESWAVISGDLTTNNPQWQKQDESGGLTPDVTGAENFTSIVSVAPSPLQEGILWVGTDDGRVQITRDGGGHWESVEKRAKAIPANTWVPQIRPSTYDAGKAFVVFDDHRRGNWTPYVFEVDDYGKQWKSLTTAELSGYCLSIVQDPINENLLFLGTEFGLYVSLNRGGHWWKWTHGLPTVAVRDMVIHPRENDLVLGTHGRSVFILDDIRPLRTMSEELLAEPLHLFEIPDAIEYQVKQTGASRFPGGTEFRGRNRPRGALITFSVNDEDLPYPDKDVEKARQSSLREKKKKDSKKGKSSESPSRKAKDRPENSAEIAAEGGGGTTETSGTVSNEDKSSAPKVKVIVVDGRGKAVRQFERKVAQGVNRIIWGLDSDAFDKIPGGDEEFFHHGGGPQVLPGKYRVKLKYEGHEAETEVDVLPDPRIEISMADRQAAWDTQQRRGKLQNTLAAAVGRILSAEKDCDFVLNKIHALQEEEKKRVEKTGLSQDDSTTNDPWKELQTQARDLKKGLKKLDEKLRGPRDMKGIVGGQWPVRKAGRAQWLLGPTWQKPTPAALTYLREAEEVTRPVLDELNRFFEEDVTKFKAAVDASSLTLFPSRKPLKLDE